MPLQVSEEFPLVLFCIIIYVTQPIQLSPKRTHLGKHYELACLIGNKVEFFSWRLGSMGSRLKLTAARPHHHYTSSVFFKILCVTDEYIPIYLLELIIILQWFIILYGAKEVPEEPK